MFDVTPLLPYASTSIVELLRMDDDGILPKDVSELVNQIVAHESREVDSWEEYEGLLVGHWINGYDDEGEHDEYPEYVTPDTKPANHSNVITIELGFTVDTINALLAAANFGDGEPLTWADIQKQGRAAELRDALAETDFMTELVDGSREACANGWLENFSA